MLSVASYLAIFWVLALRTVESSAVDNASCVDSDCENLDLLQLDKDHRPKGGRRRPIPIVTYLDVFNATAAYNVESQKTDLLSCNCANGAMLCDRLEAAEAPRAAASGCQIGKGCCEDQDCGTYEQHWITTEGGANTPWWVYPAKKNVRKTSIAIPKVAPPPGGFPWLLYFGFKVYHNGQEARKPERRKRAEAKDQCDTDDVGTPKFLDSLVYAGYAVVVTSQWEWDTQFYVPRPEWYNCNSWQYSRGQGANGCWNDGKNPDVGYFKVLFDQIQDQFPQLNYNRFGIYGVSVGSQMVSRSINNFWKLKTKKKRTFPTIKSAIMNAGGSYRCYAYKGGAYGSQPPPANATGYLPCVDTSIGCCQHGFTEEAYQDGPREWKDHPAVLMAQSQFDCYADPGASLYYYNSMAQLTSAANAVVPVCRIAADSVLHGLSMSLVSPAVAFVKHTL